MKYTRGISSLLMVMLVAFIATLVVAGIQSRLLLAAHRLRTVSDILIASYDSESEIYDTLFKFVRYHTINVPYTYSKTLPDGTEISVEGSLTDTNAERFLLTAERPFAVNKLEAVRETTDSYAGYGKLEMIMALDCTGSMNGDACHGCANSRFEAQKEAAVNFVNAIADHPGHDKIYLGLTTFTKEGQWVKYTDGVTDLTPTNNQSQILAAIDAGFGSDPDTSPACSSGSTNIGGAYDFMNTYYASTPPEPETKRIEIVVTDGNPNARYEQAQCPDSIQCSSDYGGACTPYAQDFLRCSLAKQDVEWTADSETCTAICPAHLYGQRDPSVAAYGDTVHDDVDQQVVDIFTKYAGPENENYFRTENANDLSGILDTIFTQIRTSTSLFTIRRIIQ